MVESVSEEIHTSGIPMHISHMDTNVENDDRMSTTEVQGTSSIQTPLVPVSIVLSSTIKSTIIDTSTSLPTFITHTPRSLPASSISPIFSNIMDQPITSCFSFTINRRRKSIPDDSQDDDDVMISFADI